jgi:DNA-directed RNA polymerase beta' subunit
MSASPVTLVSDFKLENVSFKEPKKNAVGGQSVLLNYTNPKTKKMGPLMIQTPKMRMPFGPEISESDTGVKKYSVNTSLANDDTQNQNLKVFTEIIRVLDEHTKKDKYPSTLKLKLPVKADGGKKIPQFDIYNDSKEIVNVLVDSEIDLSCIEKGGETVAIIQCTGVWFVGKTQFGLGWKIVQMKTFKNQKVVGYSIVDEEEEVEEEEEEVEEEEEEEVVEEEEVEVG